MKMATATKVQLSYKESSEDEENVSDTTAEDGIEDVSDGNDGDYSGSEGDGEVGEEKEKTGLADVMAKILNKKTPENKSAVLAKAKVVKKKPVDDDSEEEYDPRLSKEKQLKRKAWEDLGRVKVDITQKEKEKRLQRVATKGVVQLFNAVRKQQKELEERLNEVGTTGKKEKVLKSMSKGAFLDMLKSTPNISNTEAPKQKKMKKEIKQEEDSEDESEEEGGKPSWSILREDYMMGATMKDWDKEEDEEESEEMEESDEDDS